MITKEQFSYTLQTHPYWVNEFPKPHLFRVVDAKESLQNALEVSMNHKVEWLDEYDEVASWLSNNQGKGLLLIGPVGVGKTQLIMRAIPLIIHACYQLFFTTMKATNLCQKENFTHAKTDKLLAIDDIGTECCYVDYGNKHDVFSEAVDRIEDEGIALIASTNLGDDELRKRYGERTYDRIRGNMKVVVFTEESKRGRYQNNNQ